MEAWRRCEAEGFDLDLTLRSGQFFRYYEQDDEYLLLTAGNAIRVRQRHGTLEFAGADAQTVRTLLGIDCAYADQIARLRADPVLTPIVQRYPGLRIMRQDLHEAILGFICSSQSNIPKIRMNLHLLAHSCGTPEGKHAFLPAPGSELDLALVRDAKTGYRAKFLVASNRMLTEEFLGEISRADYGRSHELLCTLPGVGPKIADCICLFALGHGESFPVDVHIARAMRTLFPRSRLTDEKRIKSFAQARWGKDAGLAQQFLFQWARDTLQRKVET